MLQPGKILETAQVLSSGWTIYNTVNLVKNSEGKAFPKQYIYWKDYQYE